MSPTVGKNVMYMSVILCVVGLILVSGSLLTEDYTTEKPFRVDKSKIWFDEFFIIQPNSDYETYHFAMLWENTSIVQTDIDTSGGLIFKIVEEDTNRVRFERQTGGGNLRYFWTPPTGGDEYRFVFENPHSTVRNVSVKITEYYLKVVEYQEVTHHRPLLEPNYGYTGIVAIAVATALNLIPLIRESSEEYQI